MGLIQKCVADNASTAQDQTGYERRYNGLVNQYENAQAELE
jgi:hypothetical protein